MISILRKKCDIPGNRFSSECYLLNNQAPNGWYRQNWFFPITRFSRNDSRYISLLWPWIHQTYCTVEQKQLLIILLSPSSADILTGLNLTKNTSFEMLQSTFRSTVLKLQTTQHMLGKPVTLSILPSRNCQLAHYVNDCR